MLASPSRPIHDFSIAETVIDGQQPTRTVRCAFACWELHGVIFAHIIAFHVRDTAASAEKKERTPSIVTAINNENSTSSVNRMC